MYGDNSDDAEMLLLMGEAELAAMLDEFLKDLMRNAAWNV